MRLSRFVLAWFIIVLAGFSIISIGTLRNSVISNHLTTSPSATSNGFELLDGAVRVGNDVFVSAIITATKNSNISAGPKCEGSGINYAECTLPNIRAGDTLILVVAVDNANAVFFMTSGFRLITGVSEGSIALYIFEACPGSIASSPLQIFVSTLTPQQAFLLGFPTPPSNVVFSISANEYEGLTCGN